MTIFIHFAFILFTGSPVTGMLLELEKNTMYVEDVENILHTLCYFH